MPKIYFSSLLYLALNFLTAHGQEPCRTYPGSVLGECISVKQCPRLNALLGQGRGAGQTDAVQTLRRSVCASVQGSFRLCCETVVPEPLGFSSRDLPSNCGQGKLADFIVGGEKAKTNWPWMVLLVGRSVPENTQSFFCGGTLINDRFVLTAAHCNDSSHILEFARLGELIIGPDPDINLKNEWVDPIQDIPVAEFIVHPQHRQGCKRCNDIALIKLARPARMKEGVVGPVCLPLQSGQLNGEANALAGELATATGWGVDNTNPWNPTRPSHLQQVQLSIGDSNFCRTFTRGHHHGSVICAGAGDGKDTCRGDSGGPLMLRNLLGTRYYLVGITSYGSAICGAVGTQGIYTNVYHYLTWIQQTISN